MMAGIANAEFFSDVILTSPNGIWTDSRAYTTLNAAVTAIGSSDREIVIVNPQVVTTLTVPANVRLRFLRNGSITNSGQLTLNTENIIADNRQIFTGTGDIDFSPGSVVKSAWFSNIVEAFNVTADDDLTLIISKSAFVTANCVVGNNVNLKWEAARNQLTINSGVTLSNIKNIEAGNFQLFAGAGDFDFLDGTVLRLGWFRRLRSAINWVESEEVMLVVTGANAVTYNGTIPSNIRLDMDSEMGVFNMNPGVTLLINSLTVHANPRWWGAVGDGVTDDTAAIQAALNSSYSSKVPVFYPPGVYYTDTLTYYGQSMYGVPGSGNPLGSYFYTTTGLSIILGKDSKDVFQFPDLSSVAQEYIRGTVVKDLTIIVDDTTDAAGSFSRDGGEVGNAGFALPCADGTAATHTYLRFALIHGKFENVNIESLSQTPKNNSCAIFQQSLIYDFVFDHCSFQRLEFGFWGTKPTANDNLIEYSPDDLHFISANINRCINPFRIYNPYQLRISGMQIYGSVSGDQGFRLEQYASLTRAEAEGAYISSLYEELHADTVGEISIYEGRNHTIISSVLKQNYGASYITWNAINCSVIDTKINGKNAAASVVLRFGSGSFGNRFTNISTYWSNDTYPWVSDAGRNNIVTVNEYDSTQIITSKPITETISRFQPTFVRTGDFVERSPSTPYFSQEDLFITPSDMDLIGVDETITKDATIIETGEYITFADPGGANFNWSNERETQLGYRIPEAKVRVYAKIKMAASATTQTCSIQVNNVTKGTTVHSVTTSWAVYHFDADLTGLTKGDDVKFTFNNPTVNQIVYVAWVAVVPYVEHNLNAHIGTGWGIYDFDVSGGAVAPYKLGELVDNAVVTRAFYQIITDPTSGGAATIAISISTDDVNGIVTATAFNDAVFNPGYHEAIQTGTVANFSEQTTAIRQIYLNIFGADLTAGKIKVWWEYVVGE